MKLLESNKSKITKDENGENVPHLEITEVILLHCNIVNYDHQEDLRVLYLFVPDKLFVQLLDISPKKFMFLKTLNSKLYIVKSGLLIEILNCSRYNTKQTLL